MAPPPAPDIGPFQEAILVLRDVGIIGCLIIFIVGSVRGWWTVGVRVKDARLSDDEQTLNKVVLSFPWRPPAAAETEALIATLVVLEWHRPAEEIAEYIAMLHEETEWDCWFCATDGMVPPFGLVDTEGNPKDEYWAYRAANGGDPVQIQTPIEERAAQIGPEKMGDPLGEEVELGGGVKIRPYYNATLVEIPGAGVYALAEATVADTFL